jgi:hypothetical protein
MRNHFILAVVNLVAGRSLEVKGAGGGFVHKDRRAGRLRVDGEQTQRYLLWAVFSLPISGLVRSTMES